MYATGSPCPRRRTISRTDSSSSSRSGRSNCRYRSMRRNRSARAASSSASRRALVLPCWARNVVLSRTTSSRVRVDTATSGDRDRLGFLEQAAGLILLCQRLDQQVEIAVKHALQLMQRQVDAVIGDTGLRIVVRADLVAAITAANHQTPRLLQLSLALRLCHVVQARP